MKKLIIGALVGGLILFIWQTLSWTMLNLHKDSATYTENQEALLSQLSTNLPGDGQYFLPTAKPGSSAEEQQKVMESAEGKPWAIISYHKEFKMNMVTNIIRGLLSDIVLVGLFCWIISKINAPGFGTILTASISAGLIVFMNGVYMSHIWYETFDLMAHFADYIISWGLCGLWLGFWYKKK